MAIDTQDTTVQYLTTTKIGEKGQLTVPKQFREDLGLEVGAPFAVLRLSDGLILLPEQQRFEHLCQRVSSVLTHAGLRRETILGTLPEAREAGVCSPLRRSGFDKSCPPAAVSRPPREVTSRRQIRLFLDSNVLTGGIGSPWER